MTETLVLSMQASGSDQADVVHKPRLLSDNGSSYLSNELVDWLNDNEMSHVRGAPYHPQTQGKIERWHQTLEKGSNKRPSRNAVCNINGMLRNMKMTSKTLA